MNKKLFWLETLLYMIGMVYLNALKLDFKNAIDAYYWALVHVSYKAELVSYTPPPFWQRVKNDLIAFVGLFGSVAIIYCLIKIIQLLW